MSSETAALVTGTAFAPFSDVQLSSRQGRDRKSRKQYYLDASAATDTSIP